MSFERELLTMKETSTFKCNLPLDKWSHYYAVFVIMKNKQTLYFLLLQNYNTFSKHKRLNLSFKLFSYTYKQKRKDRVISDKEATYRH